MALYISDANGQLNKVAGNFGEDTSKANVNASNLSSANVTSWATTCKFERVETVYDMSSADSSINWGYTSGIRSDLGLTKDFSKYKGIKIYCQSYYESNINHGVTSNMLYLDFRNAKSNIVWAGVVTPYYYSGSGTRYVMSIMSQYDLQSKYFYNMFTYEGTTQTSNLYYVYKIEGVY